MPYWLPFKLAHFTVVKVRGIVLAATYMAAKVHGFTILKSRQSMDRPPIFKAEELQLYESSFDS